MAPKLSNLNATSTIPPDLSDHIDKKIDESMTKALLQLSKIISQDTESQTGLTTTISCTEQGDTC